jgi:hypothetical protein
MSAALELGAGRRHRGARLALVALLMVTLALGAFAATARAEFAIESFTTSASSYDAGAHADVTTEFRFSDLGEDGLGFIADGHVRRIEFDLPYGLVGDPTAFPRCTRQEFQDLDCPAASQVGDASTVLAQYGGLHHDAVYNMVPSGNEPALLAVAINDGFTTGFIRIQVRPDGGVQAVVNDLAFGAALMRSRVTLWGVPADHNGSGADRRPFMANPTSCVSPAVTTMRAVTYEDPDLVYEASASAPTAQRCSTLSFEPEVTVEPSQPAAGGPTGLDVGITVPQSDLPDGRATAHVRDVKVVLPEGMKVSPSAADGLAACSPAEFGYETDSPITCPETSKIGSMSVESPLLQGPMKGSVYLAKQNDNPFGSLLAMYLVVRGEGVTVKLAGRVDPDPVTGRLTTTFVDNPELPFSKMELSLKSGSRAPLVNPQTCGTYYSETRITSWGGQVVSDTTPMTIDEDCQLVGFSPSFEAGSVDPTAGASSTFSLTFGRGDHDQELRDIAVDMPEGLLGKIAAVDLCPDAAAAAGTCGDASKIGSVTSSAGPGITPFYLPGRAYLTGPYKGAPYGLSVVVPAVAGPFDLGLVVVRAAVLVDRTDASVRVVSDAMPRILQGIPLQIRSVNVAVDKPGFMLNPTSCAPKAVSAVVGSMNGQAAAVSSEFHASECGELPFKPSLSLALTGKRQVTTGKHPGVKAVVKQKGVGEAGIDRAVVALPKSLALDPENAQALCEFVDGTKPDLEKHCPKGSIVGRASARTPLLDKPLSGNVYFVKNVERNPKTGASIRKLPMIVVALRGEIAINLTGKSSTTKAGRLVNTFGTVPDAPISQFNLDIDGGGNGILAVTRTRRAKINVCKSKQIADVDMDGQNGKAHDFAATVKTPCPKRAKRRNK